MKPRMPSPLLRGRQVSHLRRSYGTKSDRGGWPHKRGKTRMHTCCHTSSVCLDCKFGGSSAAATLRALYDSRTRSCGPPAAGAVAADETIGVRSLKVEVRPRGPPGPFAPVVPLFAAAMLSVEG